MKRLAALMVLVALSLMASASLRAADFKTDDEGFIKNWLFLGPIALPDGSTGPDEIVKEHVKDEAKLSPKEGDTAKAGDKSLTWKAIKAEDYFFDLNAILGTQNEDCAGLLVAYVEAEAEMKDVTLQMGSNDEGRVYFNGKEVVKDLEPRTVDKDQNAAEHLTLNKGVNTIVFKVINEKNNWQGCIRFQGKDGKPIKNLKIKLAP